MNMRALLNTILEVAEHLVERNIRSTGENEDLRNTEKIIIILTLLYWVEKKIRYEDVWKSDIIRLFQWSAGRHLEYSEILQTVNKLSFAVKQRAHVEQSEMIRDILSNPEMFPLSTRAYIGLRKNRNSELIYYATVIVYYHIADYLLGENQFPVWWSATFVYHKPERKKDI